MAGIVVQFLAGPKNFSLLKASSLLLNGYQETFLQGKAAVV
jgi:hypothetical protein